jgi:hypothetical protein
MTKKPFAVAILAALFVAFSSAPDRNGAIAQSDDRRAAPRTDTRVPSTLVPQATTLLPTTE